MYLFYCSEMTSDVKAHITSNYRKYATQLENENVEMSTNKMVLCVVTV